MNRLKTWLRVLTSRKVLIMIGLITAIVFCYYWWHKRPVASTAATCVDTNVSQATGPIGATAAPDHTKSFVTITNGQNINNVYVEGNDNYVNVEITAARQCVTEHHHTSAMDGGTSTNTISTEMKPFCLDDIPQKWSETISLGMSRKYVIPPGRTLIYQPESDDITVTRIKGPPTVVLVELQQDSLVPGVVHFELK